MNIKKQLLLGSLFVSFATTTVLPMMQQEREVLYAMHALGKDFAEVDMVKDNVDMFISIFNINHDVLEAKLKKADEKFISEAKKALLVFGIGSAVYVPAMEVGVLFKNTLSSSEVLTMAWPFVYHSILSAVMVLGRTIPAFMVYDAYKARQSIKEALAVDTEILNQLVTLKVSMAGMEGLSEINSATEEEVQVADSGDTNE